MSESEKAREAEPPQRKPYDKPRLERWGKLNDLTLGGGGKKTEPSKRMTRF